MIKYGPDGGIASQRGGDAFFGSQIRTGPDQAGSNKFQEEI